ncbi:MAG: P13 family porin [Candidatus Sericytochromatia bacterium]|nr:P13 family porin [Candidatus Sericytochromatia bacterium]
MKRSLSVIMAGLLWLGANPGISLAETAPKHEVIYLLKQAQDKQLWDLNEVQEKATLLSQDERFEVFNLIQDERRNRYYLTLLSNTVIGFGSGSLVQGDILGGLMAFGLDATALILMSIVGKSDNGDLRQGLQITAATLFLGSKFAAFLRVGFLYDEQTVQIQNALGLATTPPGTKSSQPGQDTFPLFSSQFIF